MSDTAAIPLFRRDTPLYLESEDGRPLKYPRTRAARWTLRVVVTVVFAALAVWFDVAAGGDWTGTANAELIAQAQALRAATGTQIVALSYPPLPILLALVLPGSALALGLAGAVLAGWLVPSVVQSLARKHYGRGMVCVLAVTLVTTPLFAYLMVTNVETALGVAFYGLGMIDLVRFVTYANTQAGFRAGLWFAAAAFSDATTTLSALVAALAAVVLVQSRRRARVANALVVLFPTVSVLVSLMALSVMFGAGPLAAFGGGLGWDGDRAATLLGDFLPSLDGLIFLAPTLLIVVAALVLRFPRTALIAIVLSAGTLLAYVLGLTGTGDTGTTYVLSVLLAAAIIPERRSSRENVAVVLFTVILWLLGWAGALTREPIVAWLATLGGSL